MIRGARRAHDCTATLPEMGDWIYLQGYRGASLASLTSMTKMTRIRVVPLRGSSFGIIHTVENDGYHPVCPVWMVTSAPSTVY